MSMTRRTVIAAPAAIAFISAMPGIIGLAQAQSPAPAAGSAAVQAPGFYRYKIGTIEVTAINDGFFARPLDGFVRNAELSAVQKTLNDAFMPTDRLTIPFTTLVVKNGSKLMLLDTGNGDSGAPTTGTWMSNFRAAGFDPANVDTIIVSHFHGDHINGIRRKDGTAVFTKAEVLVPAPEWAFWMDDARMAAAPDPMKGAFGNVRRVFSPMARDVKQYEPGSEVAPGITSIAAHGHTPGHCTFAISSGGASLIAMSDTTNHPALFVKNPDWSPVFDMDADMARASRRRMLDMATTERSQVAFYHAPFPATGFIAKEGSGFNLVPVAWTSAI